MAIYKSHYKGPSMTALEHAHLSKVALRKIDLGDDFTVGE
jgi:hypothetical protein